MKVTKGTIKRIATVKPVNIEAIAWAAFPSLANFEATTVATPKKAPWGRPDKNLDIKSVL